ncbi:MAG: VWA domain-containing protein, partial [Rhodobacterales bacterium]|nr:VWA domain-containing protein [Rhodobacterales bacterium]
EEGEEGEEGESPALQALQTLGELDPDAPIDTEIRALAERLSQALDGDDADGDEGDEEADSIAVGEAAAALLEGTGTPATTGAIEADRVASLLEQFAPGLGWSQAPGALERTLLDRLEQLVELLNDVDKLKDIADQLGRMEEATTRKGPTEGGREEVAGVRLGGEISNVLPVELGLLGDADTESLFYQRFLARRLMSLELSGTGDEGGAMGDKRGPVIACIDTSGSMEGDPELAAKALVLAVSRQVLPKGRVMHLLLFGGSAEFQEIRLRRGHGGLEGLLDFLGFSFRGGTDFDTPLLRALQLLEERDLNLADILVVTDGLCRANQHVVDEVAKAREGRGVRVWSVVLGRDDTRGVDDFSDRVTAIRL